MRRAGTALGVAVVVAAAGCGRSPTPASAPRPPAAARDSGAGAGARDSAREEPAEIAEAPREADFATGRTVRVALETDVDRVTLSGTGDWRLYDQDGRSLLLRADAGETWTLAGEHEELTAVRVDGERTSRRAAPFVARPAARGAFVTVNGRPFRGEVTVRTAAHGLVVVNTLALEDYLRGVVPLEMGRRANEERAAVEAQAIAARSYALAHLRPDAARGYDVVSTVIDQVYGGAGAETPLADEAVVATRSLVLTYQGRVVAAPYSAVCGGHTAAAEEVWHEGGSGFLRSVSDRIPGRADRFYCDISPKFRWTRRFDRRELAAALERNLRTFVTVDGKIGSVRDVLVDGRTPSGRVGTLVLVTDRRRYALRGNDIRFVLRPPGAEILPSTMFTVEVERDGDGRVERLTLRGAGNGHGVGMCQWGAIGRARAGESARAILKAYYPGATVVAAPE